jgi:hypothetical protein
MGGTLTNEEVRTMMVKASAENFIRMMRVAYGRDLNAVTEEQWVTALVNWDRSNHPSHEIL